MKQKEEATDLEAQGGNSVTAKQYLTRAKRMDIVIRSDRDELQRLEDVASSMTVSLMGGTGGTPDHDKLGRQVDAILAQKDKINDEIDRYISVRQEIRDRILQVKPIDEQCVLRLRYLNFYTFEQIADEMNMDERHIRRLHDYALGKIEQ